MSFSPRTPSMRLLCPAKINLHLRVGPCRADGFHPLLSWMGTVGLFDTLMLGLSGAPAPAVPTGTAATGGHVATGGLQIALECDPPGLPCDERNLIVRVARAWPVEGAAPAGAAIVARLTKRTPVGAGLGGGSSNAARMVLALDRLFPGSGGGRSTGELSAFAARFGSDLPFFLAGPSSVCAGRGEIVRPIAKPRPRWAVLVLPNVMMPTPDVYRRFDALGLGRMEHIEREPDWSQWTTLDALSLLPLLANDLELPALAIRPDLGEMRTRIERLLGRPVRMSGSGSSLFTLFDGPAEARFAAQRLNDIPGSMKARIEVVEMTPDIRDDLHPAGA
jgi:4-diphosphocytidyl-2-C-methyl-D-erythritol kinase